tara:strand:- start:482 stop:1216 length:735 start_codon:yes stop_codon:yes gene_type:complete
MSGGFNWISDERTYLLVNLNKSCAMTDQDTSPTPIKVTLYRWAGQWGPFKVKIPCGECALTVDIIEDTMASELNGVPVKLDVREWLSEWWKPLRKGAWHAPIALVDGELVSEGEALNRGVLAEKVMNIATERFPVEGNQLFGKESCPHCTRAKKYLDDAGIEYTYHDVVKNPGRMYEMFPRVKAYIGEKTPVTVPQIWLDGDYIGGADQLSDKLGINVEPQVNRARSSLSPSRWFGRRSKAAAA